jgi:hypothetical protein
LLADGAAAKPAGPDADGVESELWSASSNCRTGSATATARDKARIRRMLSVLPVILLGVMARMLDLLAPFPKFRHGKH